jgi:glycosyltransferase involved in cell wall biosynthesis
MDQKRKIGILYNIDDNWIGGKYYLDSLLSVLDKKRYLFDVYIISPKRVFFNFLFIKYSNNTVDKLFTVICHRFYDFEFSTLSKFYVKFLKRKTFNTINELDCIFPVNSSILFRHIPDNKKIFWIPDFQVNFLPQLFTKKEILKRNLNQLEKVFSNSKLVLSSEASKDDFTALYPAGYADVFVLNFISSLHNYNSNNAKQDISEKYSLPDRFFLCSNQFWSHKNQKIVIEALRLLQQLNKKMYIVFTGKEFDSRDPYYAVNIKKDVNSYGLQNSCCFLGFIPRNDQIEIMKKSVAIIQPSLFEGWNTSIEDAKVLQKIIIASNLSVHREQLGSKGLYFDPNSADELANLLDSVYLSDDLFVNYDYSSQIIKYETLVQELFT